MRVGQTERGRSKAERELDGGWAEAARRLHLDLTQLEKRLDKAWTEAERKLDGGRMEAR